MDVFRLPVAMLILAAVAASLFFSFSLVGASSGSARVVSGAFLLVSLFSAIFIAAAVYYLVASSGLGKNKSAPKTFHSVAVVVPCCNESAETVGRTLSSLRKMRYGGKLAFYLLDDSTDAKNKETLAEICKKLGVTRVTRASREGYKGGALNNFLKTAKEEFIAIFDFDETLLNPNLLMETMGHFEDERIAFVQTNKEFERKSIFGQASSMTAEIFFNAIQPVNSRNGFAVFTGSCAVMRVSALKAVDGFPNVLVEDVGISFLLSVNRWKGQHVSESYARGSAVSDFPDFLAKHKRYIFGATQLFSLYLSNIGKIPLSRQPTYFLMLFGLHYVSLAQLFAALLCLALPLFTPPDAAFWAVFFYMFSNFFAIIALAFGLYGVFIGGIYAYLLNFAILLPRISSSFSAALGAKRVFNSGKEGLLGQFPEIIIGIAFLISGIALLLSGQAYGGLLFWWALLFFSKAFFTLFYSY